MNFARFCLQVLSCKYQVPEVQAAAQWVVLSQESAAQGLHSPAVD